MQVHLSDANKGYLITYLDIVLLKFPIFAPLVGGLQTGVVGMLNGNELHKT